MKKFVLAILVIVIAGCSSKLAYNNLDWLVYWYLDDYVELNDDQEPVFDRHLQKWIKWHREEELPKYIAHLKALKNEITNDNLTAAVVEEQLEHASRHWERLRSELSPQLASLAQELTDEQIIQLFAELESKNREEQEELEEEQEESEQERLEERREEIEEDIEERIGDLTDEQRRIIHKFAPKFASTHADWLEYRRTIQQAARRVFATRQTNDNFVADLTYIMNNPNEFRSEQYKQRREANKQFYAAMLGELSPTLNPKQKRKLLEEISDIISDLEDLLEDN